MGFFDKLFRGSDDSSRSSDGKSSQLALGRISQLSHALASKNLDQVESLCASSIKIDSASEKEAADLLLKTYKEIEFQAGRSLILSGLYGGSASASAPDVLWRLFSYLLDSGLSPNAIYSGLSLSHAIIAEASRSEVERALGELLKYGASPNAISEGGHTVLGAFLKRGCISLNFDPSRFLSNGAVLNSCDMQDTSVLREIFRYGFYSLASALSPSQVAANANRADERGLTLLHYAVGGLNLGASESLQARFSEYYEKDDSYVRLIKLLIDSGADIDAPTDTGYTAVDIALATKHMKAFDVLCEYSSGGASTSRGSCCDSLDQTIDGKGTPLFEAAYSGDARAVEDLLRRGADPNSRSFVNYVQHHLVEAGVPEEVSTLLFEKTIKRAAQEARRARGLDCAEVFLDMSKGFTNLYFPSMKGYEQVVALLLEAGADPDGVMCSGLFPLYVAAENGHLGVVKLLIQNGARVDMETPGGWTPLLNAADEGHVEVVRYLLLAGANPRHMDRKGNTSKLLAERNGHYDVARLLD